MKRYRLRYAPSPTGYLHIGNTRTALMNFLFAKHYNGDFIVRIEDTDQERNVEGALESQFDNMDWLGINADESYLKPKAEFGAYMQSMKFERYQQLANQLIAEKKAYKCWCTPEELEEDRERQLAKGIVAPQYNRKCLNNQDDLNNSDKPFNIRFLVPENKIYKINDIVRGEVEFNSKEIGDFVILKSNAIATYNFAVVVDDVDMQITHVVRGEEHISNTPRQCMIYEAFGWDEPAFCHLTLIVDDTKKKLSKRSGNAVFFISQYREQGYLPEALFNYIALLGWSPKVEQEIFTIEQFIEMFDEKRFSKSPSTFDMVKMKWINSQWMKKLSEDEYFDFTKKFIDTSRFDIDSKSTEWLKNVLMLYKKELEFGAQINDHLDMFFNNFELSQETKITLEQFKDIKEMIEDLKVKIESLQNFDEENLKELIKQLGIDHSKKGKELFMPVRIFTTKSEHGPELAKTISLLGKEKVIENINSIL
ncbi:glutamate--tRNA ligase [Spiroplasma culicicola]|uniref:Glutamate--tRNA ligase n=1 Tax=Spiroplasma culicicola AES-1 TaxID=1276246 RepID=W6AI46_9MOLU|nr:glutamate--tRNA ligase [Spiroplasma culicicola]AHI53379.1 glutamyl-tRNA synthetase [Spiroplasma culicicola AES-1]